MSFFKTLPPLPPPLHPLNKPYFMPGMLSQFTHNILLPNLELEPFFIIICVYSFYHWQNYGDVKTNYNCKDKAVYMSDPVTHGEHGQSLGQVSDFVAIRVCKLV